eukprot:4940834-Pleurochrysis_carterae.AAC.6
MRSRSAPAQRCRDRSLKEFTSTVLLFWPRGVALSFLLGSVPRCSYSARWLHEALMAFRL